MCANGGRLRVVAVAVEAGLRLASASGSAASHGGLARDKRDGVSRPYESRWIPRKALLHWVRGCYEQE